MRCFPLALENSRPKVFRIGTHAGTWSTIYTSSSSSSFSSSSSPTSFLSRLSTASPSRPRSRSRAINNHTTKCTCLNTANNTRNRPAI
ncbi:hypothetical protein ACKS0A_03335 [Histoplasma ohiense]